MMFNCMVVDDEAVSRKIVQKFIENTSFLSLQHVSENAIEANNFLQENQVDILFLDVEMPEMTGMELLKVLDRNIEVILITSNKEYAVEAFDESVTDYLVKPIDYSRFLKAVNKVKEKLELRHDNPEGTEESSTGNIYVKTDSKIVKVNLSEVLYVEALADYVIINTETSKHIVHSTMKGLEQRLPENMFARVHRSYIVNIDRIDSLEDQTVIIKKKIIPIGASYRSNFLKRLNFL